MSDTVDDGPVGQEMAPLEAMHTGSAVGPDDADDTVVDE